MKGIAFLNADGVLGFRTEEFLMDTDPGFFSTNMDHILKAWRFNTDDADSLYAMFSSMSALQLNKQAVMDFCKSIGVDITKLRK